MSTSNRSFLPRNILMHLDFVLEFVGSCGSIFSLQPFCKSLRLLLILLLFAAYHKIESAASEARLHSTRCILAYWYVAHTRPPIGNTDRFDDSFDSDEERKILAQGFEGCSGIPSRAGGKRCCFPGLCGDVGLGRRLSRFLSLLRMNHLSCSTGRQSLDPLSAGLDNYTSTHNAKHISSL